MDAPKPFRSRLRQEHTPETIFRMEEELAELFEHPMWKFLAGEAGYGKQVVQSALIHGATLPQVEYARMTGFLSGTGIMEEIAAEVGIVASEHRQRIAADAESESERRAALTRDPREALRG